MQVYYWINIVKSGRKDLSNIYPPGMAPGEGADTCIGKTLKENPDLSTRKTSEAWNISFTTVQNRLTKFFGMKCCHA
jgi:hypothetical protein